jgi:hypothetical protein
MADTSGRLTEEDYLSRRKFLQGQLTLAERKLGDAELASAQTNDWALDTATEDKALVTARNHVATIEGKLRGLEAAWARAQEVASAEASAEQVRARAEAARKVEELFDQYAEHVVAIEKGIMALQPHLAALAQLPVAIIKTVQPHQRAFHPDAFAMWLQGVRSTDWLRNMINGTLFAAGFGRLGFVDRVAGFDAISSDVLIERLTKNILGPLTPLVDEQH